MSKVLFILGFLFLNFSETNATSPVEDSHHVNEHHLSPNGLTDVSCFDSNGNIKPTNNTQCGATVVCCFPNGDGTSTCTCGWQGCENCPCSQKFNSQNYPISTVSCQDKIRIKSQIP